MSHTPPLSGVAIDNALDNTDSLVCGKNAFYKTWNQAPKGVPRLAHDVAEKPQSDYEKCCAGMLLTCVCYVVVDVCT